MGDQQSPGGVARQQAASGLPPQHHLEHHLVAPQQQDGLDGVMMSPFELRKKRLEMERVSPDSSLARLWSIACQALVPAVGCCQQTLTTLHMPLIIHYSAV